MLMGLLWYIKAVLIYLPIVQLYILCNKTSSHIQYVLQYQHVILSYLSYTRTMKMWIYVRYKDGSIITKKSCVHILLCLDFTC